MIRGDLMSDSDVTTEDMAHMRREGSMRDYLRLVRRPSAGPVREAAEPVSAMMPPDHIPGAWPAATGSGAPGVRVCPCSGCISHGKDQPERADLPVDEVPEETR